MNTVIKKRINGVLVEHTIDGQNQLGFSATPIQKARNAALAAARIAKSVARREPVIVSDQEHDRRFAICQACEHFTGTSCRLCGCIAKFKTKLATEKCPIGKW